jgi:Flp pilus assembly protein TadB
MESEMMTMLLLAIALALGVDPVRVVLLAAAVYVPYLLAILVIFHLWKSRPEEDTRPALFCDSVASELRAGASLRSAVAVSAASVGARLRTIGSTLDAVAAQVAEEFPSIGQELGLTIATAGRTGADTASLFDEIGALALAQTEIRREVRTATAPGRATALVLIGAPVLYTASRFSSGGIDRLLATPYQRYAALLGFGLFAAGLVAVMLIVWRAGR